MPFDSCPTEIVTDAVILCADSPPPPDASSAILRAARAKVAAGWWQGCYGVSTTGDPIEDIEQIECVDVAKVCVLGAIILVLRCGDDISPACQYFVRAIDGRRNQSAAFVASEWNDVVGRTQQEVVDAFDRAIALAEAEHA